MPTYSQLKLYSSLWKKVSEAKEEKKKKAPLNKPFRTPGGPKKFGVYVKNEKGNVVVVRFGDPNMEIKRDDPQRRKNFRARHSCDNPGPKTKARYWSCKMWERGKSVTDYTKGSEEWDGVTFWEQEELLKVDPSLANAMEEDSGCDCESEDCDCEESEAKRPGPKSSAQTPAKPEDKKKGSKKNSPGSAGTKPDAKEKAEKSLQKEDEKQMVGNSFESQADSITYSKKIVEALKNKVKEHNAKHSKKVNLSQLKKVYRRGAGAFSSSHRPGKTRGQWAMARVNAFLRMAAGGKVKDSYRKADGDILKASEEIELLEEDFVQADKDLVQAGVDPTVDFEVDELYIEEEEKSQFLSVLNEEL
jgi:hypothetical protein